MEEVDEKEEGEEEKKIEEKGGDKREDRNRRGNTKTASHNDMAFAVAPTW